MADTLDAQRRYLEADAAYSELLYSKPNTPEILVKRGAIRMCLGRYKEARTDLEDSLANAPSRAGLGTAHVMPNWVCSNSSRAATRRRHSPSPDGFTVEAASVWASGFDDWRDLEPAGGGISRHGFLTKAGEAIGEALGILTASRGNNFQLCMALVNAGRVFLEQRRFAEAAQSLEQVLESATDENGCTAKIASGLGHLHSAQKDFKAMILRTFLLCVDKP